jgi:hypothetical protein
VTPTQHATEIRRAERIATRPLTTIEARLDLAHLGGMALELDRQIATQPRRLARRWRWSIRAAARLLASLQRAPVAPAVSAPVRVVEAPPAATTGSSVVFVQMRPKVRR